MEVLADYRGVYCIESFHPAVLLRLEKRYPEVLRGQLSQNFFRGSETGLLSWPSSVVMTYLLSTSLTGRILSPTTTQTGTAPASS